MADLPPNVWDSRAPYATFLEYHKSLNRFLRVTRASYAIAEDVATRLRDDQPVEALQPAAIGEPRNSPAHHDFKHLRKSYCNTVGDFRNFIPDEERALHNAVAISAISVFESFSFCWIANMLLDCAATDRLDQVTKWQALARGMLEGRTPNGTLHDLLGRFPGAQERLSSVPPVKHDPATRKAVVEVSRFEQGALIYSELWRRIRNCLVHRHGRVDEAFVSKNRLAWARLREDIRGVPPLVPNSAIDLSPGLLAACLTVHDQLAKAMRDWLRHYSEERRGHVFAPGPYRGALKPEEMPPIPPLVLTEEEPALVFLRDHSDRGDQRRQA
jgi:hypothetical protein